ncbi:hypothetical protein CMV_023416 [Castanea mollissima]|uniref:DNA topoisomerase (ATP-hydrolyzing) n=1 Tax=Castanea mollissima TaxID=60419 RepID=A0A8J4QLG0_9ROSI|nr:hypothetical protein CMV_023416 [Castanea mollissima]
MLIFCSCMELKSQWLNLLKELHQKPVVLVGLLPPKIQVWADNKDDTQDTIVEWLDKQDRSVVYVAPGRDSAKALALAGLAAVGRDYYGVFPLRGKLLNIWSFDDNERSGS